MQVYLRHVSLVLVGNFCVVTCAPLPHSRTLTRAQPRMILVACFHMHIQNSSTLGACLAGHAHHATRACLHNHAGLPAPFQTAGTQHMTQFRSIVHKYTSTHTKMSYYSRNFQIAMLSMSQPSCLAPHRHCPVSGPRSHTRREVSRGMLKLRLTGYLKRIVRSSCSWVGAFPHSPSATRSWQVRAIAADPTITSCKAKNT